MTRKQKLLARLEQLEKEREKLRAQLESATTEEEQSWLNDRFADNECAIGDVIACIREIDYLNGEY